MVKIDANVMGLLFLVSVGCCLAMLLRPLLFGYDAFGYLSLMSGQVSGLGHASDIFFKLLPPNLWLLKGIMFGLVFVSVLGLFFFLKRFFDKGTSLIALLVGLAFSPVLLFQFAKFENELFALPLLLWGAYFVLSKRWQVKVLCLPLFGIAFWFWEGSIVFVLLVGLLGGWWLIPLIGIGFLFFWSNWVQLLPFGDVLFNQWGFGLLDLFLLLFFVLYCFWQQENKRLWLVVGLGVVFVFLSGRFTIVLVPFLLIGIGYWVKNYAIKKDLLKLLVIGSVFLIIGWNIVIFEYHPTQNELNLTQEFVNICDSNVKCLNSWSEGWWITSLGGHTKYKAGTMDLNYQKETRPYYALSDEKLDCNVLNSQPLLTFYYCE